MSSLLRCMMLDLYQCDRERLVNEDFIKEHLIKAARIGGAEVVGYNFHTFKPWGVSGVVTIAESHLAVHTWPEYDFAAVSIETCGQRVDPKKMADYLIKVFRSEHQEISEFGRGYTTFAPDLKNHESKERGESCASPT
ncbi:MAG: adenosylmethionine decarboxylase [Patescibacteria group bacterium]